MPRLTDDIDPDAYGDLDDEEIDTDWEDNLTSAGVLGLPEPSGGHRDPYARPDPGVSAWSSADVRGVAPIFEGPAGDAKIKLDVQNPDGSWSYMGTFPPQSTVEALIQEVQRTGTYRVTLMGPDGKPVAGKVRTWKIDEDNVTLRKARAMPTTPSIGGGGWGFGGGAINSLEDIGKLLTPQQQMLAEERARIERMEAEYRREAAEREERLAEREAEVRKQQLTVSEFASERQQGMLEKIHDKAAETSQQQMTVLASIMQQSTEAARIQHEQAMERMRSEAAEQRRRDEEARRREREEYERRQQQLRLEYEQQRERDRQRAEDERRAYEERMARQEREEAERRERREREDAREREERRRLEQERQRAEEARLEREREQDREERRYRRERDDKLMELQQRKEDPFGPVLTTITTLAGVLTQFGIEPGDLITKFTSGAKSSALSDLIKEGLGVVKAGIEAANNMPDEEGEDDSTDTEVMMLPDGQGGVSPQRITTAQADQLRARTAALQQQARDAGVPVDTSSATFGQGQPPGTMQSGEVIGESAPDTMQPRGEYRINTGSSGGAPAPQPAASSVAQQLAAEAGHTPAPAAPAQPDPNAAIRVTRAKIAQFVENTLMQPESSWAGALIGLLMAHPDVDQHIKQVGIRPALRNAAATEEQIAKVIQMVEAAGYGDGNPYPYGA